MSQVSMSRMLLMVASVINRLIKPNGGTVFFGFCTCRVVKKIRLRKDASKHRKHVNGLVKLERNMWICEKADQLDQAFISGNMHAMYSELGALTKFAKNKTSSNKVCRVCDADGNPTQSYSEEKLASRAHFSKTMSASTVTMESVVIKDRAGSNDFSNHDRYKHINLATCMNRYRTLPK